MKKMLFLALSVIMACTLLVSCDDKIGKELDDYLSTFKFPEVREEVELDLYIITEDSTTDAATKTVNQAINKYTEAEYMTKLNIHYIKATNYKQEVLSAAKGNTAGKKADIVLINSAALYDELMAGGYLAPLDSYLDANKIKSYSLINKRIPEIKADIPASLFDATAASPDADGNVQFVIPNNRLIGSYKYLVIKDREKFFASGYSENIFNDPLFDAADFYNNKLLNADPDKNIDAELITDGYYSQKADFEKEGYICYVYGTPTVTRSYAFESAFAVINQAETDKHLEERSMEIIYALNTSPDLRNLLQYGDYLTHYDVEIDAQGNRIIKPNANGEIYRMNIDYTGNIFTAEYCSDVWNPQKRHDAAYHNKDAKYAAPDPA